MKKTTIIIVLLVFINSFGQVRKPVAGSWSIGAGISNSITHGDLRTRFSLNNNKNGLFNLGGYSYIDKMFTPAFGLELKGRYTNMSGSASKFSYYKEFLNPLGLNLKKLRFESTSYSVELNTIFNISSFRAVPYPSKERKWNFATYAGIGWHTYKPITYNIETNDLILDLANNSQNSNQYPNSIYFMLATSFKYKLSTNLDIELRQDFNVNEEDDLDGARSFKNNFDLFFNTNIGIVYKLNKEDTDNYIWLDNTPISTVTEDNKSEFTDSDKDGVIDQFDQEANTEEGALVYGNGVTIDSDKDGIPDHKDKCPLKHAKTTDGCPTDIDGDGILDDRDLCPNIAGTKLNLGCPEKTEIAEEIHVKNIEILSVDPIFFDSNQHYIKKNFNTILSKTAITMAQIPDLMIVLEGHADVGGSSSYNLALSNKRINAVINALIVRGVPKERISTKGFGEKNPTFENIKFSSFNRRVDLILTK